MTRPITPNTIYLYKTCTPRFQEDILFFPCRHPAVAKHRRISLSLRDLSLLKSTRTEEKHLALINVLTNAKPTLCESKRSKHRHLWLQVQAALCSDGSRRLAVPVMLPRNPPRLPQEDSAAPGHTTSAPAAINTVRTPWEFCSYSL